MQNDKEQTHNMKQKPTYYLSLTLRIMKKEYILRKGDDSLWTGSGFFYPHLVGPQLYGNTLSFEEIGLTVGMSGIYSREKKNCLTVYELGYNYFVFSIGLNEACSVFNVSLAWMFEWEFLRRP